MINKYFFDGPVGDYCIARNTIKCLFKVKFTCLLQKSILSPTLIWTSLLASVAKIYT